MTSIRSIALVVAALIPGVGCSQSTTVVRPDRLPPDQGATQARAIANQFAGKEVTIKVLRPEGSNLTEVPVLTGKIAALDAKEFLLYEAPGKARRIPFEQTRSLGSNNRGGGALTGLLIGAAPGAVAGLMFDAMLTLGFDRIVLTTMAGAVLFGAAGAGIGALIGRRTTLTF